jgi:hypothetical protein
VGTAAVSVLSTAALPVLEAGAGLAAATYTVKIVINQFNKAEKEPYKWLLAIMGIFAAFTIDVLKDIIINMYPQKLEDTSKTLITAAVAGITALTYYAGGFLWQFETSKKANIPIKSTAVVLFLLPLLGTYLYYLVNHSNHELVAAIINLNLEIIAPVGVFLLLFVVTLVLGYRYRKN